MVESKSNDKGHRQENKNKKEILQAAQNLSK